MKEVIRRKAWADARRVSTEIFGLNIFASNDVAVSTGNDPRILFLRELAGRGYCCGHTGNLLDLADDPSEIFTRSTAGPAFLIAKTGISAGDFYDAADWLTFSPCMVPAWAAYINGAIDEDVLLKIMEMDALAIYFARDEVQWVDLEKLAESPFRGQDDWLDQVLALFEVIVTSEGDGFQFRITAMASHKHSVLEIIGSCLATCEESIRAHPWFRRNETFLAWDAERSLCLRM